MYYSVPYEYIKHQVDIRITPKIIEVFFKNFRIASHRKLLGKEGQLSTIPEHMPDNHRMYQDFNREYYLNWAEAIGFYTLTTVNGILTSYKVEKQALKSCMSLTRLVDKYSVERVEAACKKALEYSSRPNLNSIKTILKTGQDKLNLDSTTLVKENTSQASSYGFTRGAAYFGRKEK
jgi:hypothetical protein